MVRSVRKSTKFHGRTVGEQKYVRNICIGSLCLAEAKSITQPQCSQLIIAALVGALAALSICGLLASTNGYFGGYFEAIVDARILRYLSHVQDPAKKTNPDRQWGIFRDLEGLAGSGEGLLQLF